MSKQAKKGLAFSDATPQQIAASKQIIDDAAKHRYYVSRIYGMYNTVSGKNEAPQTCSSCLRARAKEIKKWYDEGAKDAVQVAKAAAPKAPAPAKDTKTPVKEVTPVDEAAKPAAPIVENADITEEEAKAAEAELTAKAAELDPNGLPEPAIGTSRIPMEDGTFIDFTPNDGADFANGVKGMVLHTDGAKVKAGTYKTAQGHDVKVQVGSKATYVEAFDDLAS